MKKNQANITNTVYQSKMYMGINALGGGRRGEGYKQILDQSQIETQPNVLEVIGRMSSGHFFYMSYLFFHAAFPSSRQSWIEKELISC